VVLPDPPGGAGAAGLAPTLDAIVERFAA
jgi:hypothetical protein